MKRPQPCRACGRPVLLVQVIPARIRPGTTRKQLPLNPTYDPACGVRASHALSTGGTTCRPLLADETPGPDERPALTHFATCPARNRTAQEP